MDNEGVDFAFVAWREEGTWMLAAPASAADDLESLQDFARQRQGESGCVAFVSVADEFFVCIRVQGAKTRVMLSDITTALDWPLAEEAAEMLGVDLDDIEDIDGVEPAGDLTLLADYGMTHQDIDLLCSDPELYPDEQIGTIAARIGFAAELTSLLDVMSPAGR